MERAQSLQCKMGLMRVIIILLFTTNLTLGADGLAPQPRTRTPASSSYQVKTAESPLVWKTIHGIMVTTILGVILSHTNPCFAALASNEQTTSTTTAPSIARLKACEANTNCISTNYKEPPNRYMSPLQLVNNRDEAFRRAVRDLSTETTTTASFDIVEIIPKDYYIHLTVPGTAPQSVDDLELLFPFTGDDEIKGGGIVHIRCQARVTLPPPPFCVKKNCINGNMDQRQRAEHVAYDVLGLPPANQRQMQTQAKWTPIFFNSDRVPDMIVEEEGW